MAWEHRDRVPGPTGMALCNFLRVVLNGLGRLTWTEKATSEQPESIANKPELATPKEQSGHERGIPSLLMAEAGTG